MSGDMPELVLLITASTVFIGMILRTALWFWVAKWSLEADERGRKHAIRLLRELQDDRLRPHRGRPSTPRSIRPHRHAGG